MKLLVVHNRYLSKGGEDVCVERETAALRQAGVEVMPFEPASDLALRSKANAFLAPWGAGVEGRLEHLLRESRPDLVHVHNLFPLLSPRLFLAARRLGIPVVLTLHNYRPLCLNGLFLTPGGRVCELCSGGNYFHGIARGCYRRNRMQSAGLAAHLSAVRFAGAYSSVSRFIAPSAFLRERFAAAGFPAEHIVVQGHFLPEMPDQAVAAPEPYLLFLGRLSAEKGLSWLLRVFADPPMPIRLIVAGDGPLRPQVESARSRSIEFRGFVDGAARTALLRSSLALVMPSRCYENFPMAVAEANASGAPALVADHGGLREIVAPGRNGDRFLPDDQSSFWNAVGRLRELPDPVGFRAHVQEHARRTFSAARFVEARLSLYHDVLRSGA